MKHDYPDYRQTSIQHVRDSLTSAEEAILERFLQVCRISCGERTLKDLQLRLLQARDVIEKPFDSWTKDDVEHFTALLNNSGRTQWTKHGTLATFKRFVRWFYKDLTMLENIRLKRASKFNYQRINDSTLLTAEEVQRLVRAAETLRMRAFIMLLYESGARPEEIRRLRWKDVRFRGDHADVNIFAPKTTQGRTIPIKEAVVHLKRWKQEYCLPEACDSYLIFPGKVEHKQADGTVRRTYDPQKIMQGSVLSKMFRRLARNAGIGRPVYPYLLRHSRLTALYNQLPEQIVKKFGGHAPDSDMPKIYSHISNRDVKEAMLEKIYHVEELTDEQKNTLQKEIDQMKLRLNERDKILAVLAEAVVSGNVKVDRSVLRKLKFKPL